MRGRQPKGARAEMTKHIRHFHARVVGRAHTNPDGQSRQDVLLSAKPGMPLDLIPEPDGAA